MEWDLLLALFIGIAFGYVLESAGFSSSRRLAGVFYGYDFTVLRVFFTAGVTAMVGVFILNYLGWIDISLVYVNPTFIWPAIVGGVVMGFGFIFGGYCPGTSVTAAVIGKIDAMVFLVGIFLGIVAYGEFFPVVQEFSVSGNLGRLFVFDSLGISAGWFAFLMIAVALIAFGVTALIEERVNPDSGLTDTKGMSYAVPVLLSLFVGVVLIFTPFQKITGINELAKDELNASVLSNQHFVHPDEVAFKLLNDYHPMVLVDVRSSHDAAQFSLPGSVNIPLGSINQRRWNNILNDQENKVVLYSNGTTEAQQAWIIAKRLGYENIYVLKGGLNGFFETLQTTVPPGLKMEVAFTNRFRQKAIRALKEQELTTAKDKTPQVVDEPVVTATRGGC